MTNFTMRAFAVVRQNTGDGWLLLSSDGSAGAPWSVLDASTSSLSAVINGALMFLRENSSADFSFSTRTASEIAADPLCERADLLSQAAPGASIVVLAPEGRRGQADLWAQTWRTPRGGVSSAGTVSRFRVQTLPEQITKFFAGEDFRSFDAERYSEKFEVAPPVRPPFQRELLVRHAWSAMELCPDSFPTEALIAERRAKQEATEASYAELRDARDPKVRRQRLQAAQAAERSLLPGSGATVEQRQALEQDRKAAFGGAWTTPAEAE
jgi:hypothetical protein